ncbi:MAG: hypothetical protein NC182_06545 [Prevotella sp.]|nr:hypothetical protein [Staphylococcus sp.]MCM1350845.1 hypothetical protein [Prevotella sp.]
MPFKGTNAEAYKRAKRGKTKKERSRIYYKEKEKLEKHSSFFSTFKDLIFGSNSKENYIPKKKETPISTISKIKPKTHRIKFVPQKLILDEIRNYRSSKIISHISDGLATILVKISCNDMSNDQKNMLRSTIAFIASETINKSLEKPLKVIDNIKMFVKVSKVVYRVLMYFDEKLNEYCINKNEIVAVRNNDSEYLAYLDKHPRIKEIEKRNEVLDYLGKKVFVKVDRPLGSVHPKYSDLIYKLNYGYLPNTCASDGEEQDAYIVGADKPVQEYTGIVKAIIIRKNDIENKLVVCSKDKSFSKEEINKLVQFQEKFFDIEIIM